MMLRNYKPALFLGLLSLSAALILASLDRVTRDRIALEQDRRALSALIEVLPPDRFDNELARDWIELSLPGLDQPARVYRARLNNAPAATITDLTTPRGYSGDIRVLVATELDGTVIAVRILDHRETPGLGDRIETRRSDWIEQFSGRSLGDPAATGWAPKQRGGDFDGLSNATITAGAVIDVVRRALDGLEQASDTLWRASAYNHESD
jgi:Na+-translocating ferredoxin:NAD+ oxidoreductase subunit G